MDTNSFINAAAEAIAGDPKLDNWCEVNYGRSPRVYLNFDEQNPPGAEDCPYIAIYPTGKGYPGGKRKTYDDSFEFICMLHDESTREHYRDTIVEYAGVHNIEEMRKLVLSAVAKVIAATRNASVKNVEVLYETIAYFPFILVGCHVEIETPYLIGSGNPITNE